MRLNVCFLCCAAIVLFAGPSVRAADVGVVCNVKILSDKVEDVSSIEAWKSSAISPGMSDREKALKCWETIVRYQLQNSPPREYLHHENTVLDAMKMINVYGYSFCSVAAAEVQSLARAAGLEARGWTIAGHVICEVKWDGQWHMLDASLINYFPKPDGDIASVDEIMAAVKAWYDEHPGFKGNHDKLYKFGREEEGWGWKRGPRLLAECPFYGIRGWLPAGTHGWYSTMQEYDGRTLFEYESGYSQGYRVNVRLRPGESLTRNWSNEGLHVNMDEGKAPGCMNGEVGKNDLRHSPSYGDLAPGRIGNGVRNYVVPVASAALKSSVLAYENIAPAEKGLRIVDGAKPGVLIIDMPSDYVVLNGEIALNAAIGTDGRIEVSFSDNNGLDWTKLGTIEKAGEQRIDLSRQVIRRYDHRLKFEIAGRGTGLDALRITESVQHSQRPLPALDEGKNTVAFSAGPAEGTVTIEASSRTGPKDKQLVFTDFKPAMQNIAADRIQLKDNTGSITFPVETPGDMTRLRFGCFAFVNRPEDGWDLQVSFDEGKTFKTVAGHPRAGRRQPLWTTFEEIPAGTREALVRYAGTGREATILNFRIDADYLEPSGGFAPVKITYVWTEDGVEKRDVHIARSPSESYTISCKKKPLMKSIVLELAD